MQIADLKCFYLYKVMNKCWWDVFFIPPRDVLYNYFSFVHFGVTQQPSGTFRNKPPITTDRNENSKLRTHSVWKSQKKSHSTLRAKRATFTFWVDKSWLKMPKIGEFIAQLTLVLFEGAPVYLRWRCHGVWKSKKKSHSTLRAKRATFTFWVDKS